MDYLLKILFSKMFLKLSVYFQIVFCIGNTGCLIIRWLALEESGYDLKFCHSYKVNLVQFAILSFKNSHRKLLHIFGKKQTVRFWNEAFWIIIICTSYFYLFFYSLGLRPLSLPICSDKLWCDRWLSHISVFHLI